MLKLILGTDWVKIRETVLSAIAQDVQKEKPGGILMVPELISHDMERRLCVVAGDTASRFAEVLSFPRLASRVAETVCKAGKVCMDAGGRVVTMAAATRQLASKLKVYASVETKPEFLVELVEAVDEFKRCCITPKDLQQAAAQCQGSFAQKLEELSLILSAYDSLCARGNADPRDQMTWLLEQLEDSDFGENHVFYIDGFPDFTRQHLAILAHLIKVSPQVTVGVNCDRPGSHAMAFEKAGQTAAELIRCAKQAGVEVEIQTLPRENTPLASVCLSLFQGALPQNVAPESLRLVRAGDSWQALRLAAARIRQLVQNGCRYRDISLVCADMEGIRGALELEFDRWQIPVYRSGTEEILGKSVISALLCAMDAALEGFEQRDTLRYLRSVLSPLTPDESDLVENYAILWGIRGSLWQKEWTQHPDGLGEEWTADAKMRLRQLNAAREMALNPLFALGKQLKEGKTLAEQVDGLYDFLETLQLADRLEVLSLQLEAQGDPRSAQILDQLWEILLNALTQLRASLGDTHWEPEHLARLLTILLSQYDVGTIPPVLDAVTVGSVSAMRCQQPKHLLVIGAEEGQLPGYGGAKGLLSDQEREALRALGVTLTGGAMEGLQAEFAEIYGVFCGARESITVFCGGEPSYLYQRLLKITGTEDCSAAPLPPGEAAAKLARLQDREAAVRLGLAEEYDALSAQAAFQMGSLGKERIQGLYGAELNLSASQVDRLAECRLSYFLKYGLRAKERKEATVDPAEFGTYVHAVLEHTARQVMEKGGFSQVSLEETLGIALAYADKYAQERFAELDSQRLQYLFGRNRRELEMVVQELWRELKESAFAPEAFELSFGDQGVLPGIQIPSHAMPAQLRGFVDRVDIWHRQGQSYFRVVDYKTGKKDFDYCDIFSGVGLQMLLYLFALARSGEAVVGGQAQAAGVQYFPARVPLVSADGRLSDQEAEQARQKEWKRKGLLLKDEDVLRAMEPGEDIQRLCCTRRKDGSLFGDLADREQLQLLERYVFGTLASMVEQIAIGAVDANPYTRGANHNACAFCPYGAICRSKAEEGRRNYKAMPAQKFWEDVYREVTDRG